MGVAIMHVHVTYWDFIESEAALITTDGCSKGSGVFRRHCRGHDLSYFYANDPVDAYRRFLAGDPDYWEHATPIIRRDADAAFRRGMQSDSPMGFFSPFAAFRWLLLKMVGGRAWDAHRAREQREREADT